MKLSEWARSVGVHPKTAYRWWREGTLPVPARQINARVILVDVPQPVVSAGRVVGYARVSSHDQRPDLDRQTDRIRAWASLAGVPMDEMVSEVGSGMNGNRRKLRRLLSDPTASVIVVEHRERFG